VRGATVVAAALALPLAGCAGRGPDHARDEPGFAALVAALSEPGGFFDTDNLISNEASYLHVVDRLQRHGVSGGAYVGVGPDQNFSYIAVIRPRVAFIVDLRRDNLLEQLLFKALFALSGTRVEYLSLLLGRAVPARPLDWTGQPLTALTTYVDTVTTRPADTAAARRRVDSVVVTFGVPLSAADRATIARFHQTFVRAGLDLKFESFGRSPQRYYPTYRDLLLERDLTGRQASYLADEADYRFVRGLQARDRIIPVVGDLAGPHALAAIADYLQARGERLSALYTSNVEFYLFRAGTFDRYAGNVAKLPRAPHAVLIRSLFLTTFGPGHPQAVPGYASVQLLEPLDQFVEESSRGRYARYRDLVLQYLPD
jgi:hypothetical protein